MEKQAAYELGVQLALEEAGLTKTAGPKAEALKALLERAGGAVKGGVGKALPAAKEYLPGAGAGAALGGGLGALTADEDDRLTAALLGAGLGAGAGVGGQALYQKVLKDRLARALGLRAFKDMNVTPDNLKGLL